MQINSKTLRVTGFNNDSETPVICRSVKTSRNVISFILCKTWVSGKLGPINPSSFWTLVSTTLFHLSLSWASPIHPVPTCATSHHDNELGSDPFFFSYRMVFRLTSCIPTHFLPWLYELQLLNFVARTRNFRSLNYFFFPNFIFERSSQNTTQYRVLSLF